MTKGPDKTVTDSISELGRKFSDTTLLMHEAIATKAGLSGADHKYLGILMQNGAMTAGELANFTGLTTGAVTGVIDRLERKALVHRAPDKQDRRKIMIIPHYENAMRLLGGTFEELKEKMVSLMTSFSAKEIEIIEKYLHSVIEVMKQMTDKINSERKVK